MSIDEILEEMDELLDKAGSVPFVSHKKVIDGERMRELINDVRLNMPHELKEAKKIEFDCQRILFHPNTSDNIITQILDSFHVYPGASRPYVRDRAFRGYGLRLRPRSRVFSLRSPLQSLAQNKGNFPLI